jgi:histidinol-phosphate/aromatic aminotransferase/cobyric acid decarboxylase-like protein
MSTPSEVPELAAPQDAEDEEAEAARCLEEASRMVQEFSAAGGTGALNALLAVAEGAPAEATAQALQLAGIVTAQTETLQDEVARFLSVTRET